MRLRRLATLVLAVLLVGGLSAAVAGGSFADGTSAAWTDRTQVSAKVAAGTWSTTTPSTCVAYDQSGAVIAGCAVSENSYTDPNWGNPGQRVQNYYLQFTLPPGTDRIEFDVDLSTVKGSTPGWSWQTSGFNAGQFTPGTGWSCDELPRVRGVGPSWAGSQSGSVVLYFQITESRPGLMAVCT